MIVAHTVLGKGVSYMEDRVAWHYQSMTAEQYTRALLDLDCDNREAAA